MGRPRKRLKLTDFPGRGTFTADEVARMCGVSARTIKRKAQQGLITAVPRAYHCEYVFLRESVEKFLRLGGAETA
jgi:hypothetical protein